MKYISTAALGDTLENLKERKIVSYAELVSEIAAIPAANVRPVVLCRDCYWWTKQKASLQGRCALLGISPTRAWFCANGQKKATCDPHVCGKCGRSSEIVCLVDGVPYCNRCLSLALGVEPTEEDET